MVIQARSEQAKHDANVVAVVEAADHLGATTAQSRNIRGEHTTTCMHISIHIRIHTHTYMLGRQGCRRRMLKLIRLCNSHLFCSGSRSSSFCSTFSSIWAASLQMKDGGHQKG